MTALADRIEELLVDEALGALQDAEREELERLLAANPDIDRHAFQRAAALVLLASVEATDNEMPDALKSRIVSDGEAAAGRID